MIIRIQNEQLSYSINDATGIKYDFHIDVATGRVFEWRHVYVLKFSNYLNCAGPGIFHPLSSIIF